MRSLEGVRVLIVDDSNTIRRSAETYLATDADKRKTGLHIKLVENGFEALPEIVEFRPDIVLLDVTMPRVDGFTICRAIKSHPIHRACRVLMITSLNSLFDRAKGEQAGADDYIAKPFTKGTILQFVAKHAPRREEAARQAVGS